MPPCQVDFVVLSGDIVDGRGKSSLEDFREPFSVLAELVSGLGLKWIYIPGNRESCVNVQMFST